MGLEGRLHRDQPQGVISSRGHRPEAVSDIKRPGSPGRFCLSDRDIASSATSPRFCGERPKFMKRISGEGRGTAPDKNSAFAGRGPSPQPSPRKERGEGERTRLSWPQPGAAGTMPWRFRWRAPDLWAETASAGLRRRRIPATRKRSRAPSCPISPRSAGPGCARASS
jgi:hypothetical protein